MKERSAIFIWSSMRTRERPGILLTRCTPILMVAASRVLFCFWLAQTNVSGQTLALSPLQASPAAYRADRILIQPEPAAGPAPLAGVRAAQKSEVLQTFG